MKTFLKVWLGISFIAIGIGVGLLVIAVASGARLESTSTFSIDESYDGVQNIDFDINYGEVKIVQGDTFSIKADHLVKDEFDSYVTDSTWYIKESESSYFEIFGLEIPVSRIISLGDSFSPEITITLPQGFKAENFILKVGAGDVLAEEINTAAGDFSVDAGKIQINQLTVDSKAKYYVGAGDMVFDNVTAKDVNVDCGTGNIDIEGTVTGNSSVECGVGNVELSLMGEKEDYSYEISCGVGDVEIDGTDYNSISNEIVNNNENAENSLYLNCSVGKITVEFN